jgi:hypothetical protein
MRPPVVDAIYQELPVAERVMFQKSGHVTMIDEPEKMNLIVAHFFDRVEASRGSDTQFMPKATTVGDTKLTCLEDGTSSVDGTNVLLVTGAVLLAFFLGAFLGRSGRGRGKYQTL